MKRSLHILLIALATALLVFAAAACVQPLDLSEVDPNSRELTIRIYMPTPDAATKAGTGNVDSVDPESRIYNLQVWMFNHADPAATGDALAAIDAQTAVVYGAVTNINWHNTSQLPSGSGYYTNSSGYWANEYTYEMRLVIPGYLLDRPDSDMKFDFYILANGPSIGSPATQLSTRGQIKAMTFASGTTGSDWFGTTTPRVGETPSAAIGSLGLPITGFFNSNKTTGSADGVDISFIKNRQLSFEQMREYAPIVQLERAVSKVRFVFAKPAGLSGVQITKIVIDDQVIPDAAYVPLFPRENGTATVPAATATAAYSGSPAATIAAANTSNPLIANASILGVSDVEALRSDSDKKLSTSQAKAPADMTAQEYETFLDGVISDKNAPGSQRYVYLRESDKPIKGKIYYKLTTDGQELSSDFDMSAVPGYDHATTNFHRNHSWTVYGYFRGGHLLQIWPFVNPWEYHQETTSFSSQIECTNVKVEGEIETTNHYLSNEGDLDKDGNVITTSSVEYYANYYQVRRLDMTQSNPHFEVSFTPSAPFGGYWMLVPEFIGEGSQDMFDIEVERVAGGETDELIGQIMKMEVKIIIRPSANYNYANDEHSYAMILKSYFSPAHNFSPSYSADSEFQDVHRDGRYSYWRFTLTHGDH